MYSLDRSVIIITVQAWLIWQGTKPIRDPDLVNRALIFTLARSNYRKDFLWLKKNTTTLLSKVHFFVVFFLWNIALLKDENTAIYRRHFCTSQPRSNLLRAATPRHSVKPSPRENQKITKMSIIEDEVFCRLTGMQTWAINKRNILRILDGDSYINIFICYLLAV